jgi:hypothetical protein
MTTSTATQYQYLEPRPGTNYCQLFLKGRRIRAAVVHEAVPGPATPIRPRSSPANTACPWKRFVRPLIMSRTTCL